MSVDDRTIVGLLTSSSMITVEGQSTGPGALVHIGSDGSVQAIASAPALHVLLGVDSTGAPAALSSVSAPTVTAYSANFTQRWTAPLTLAMGETVLVPPEGVGGNCCDVGPSGDIVLVTYRLTGIKVYYLDPAGALRWSIAPTVQGSCNPPTGVTSVRIAANGDVWLFTSGSRLRLAAADGSVLETVSTGICPQYAERDGSAETFLSCTITRLDVTGAVAWQTSKFCPDTIDNVVLGADGNLRVGTSQFTSDGESPDDPYSGNTTLVGYTVDTIAGSNGSVAATHQCAPDSSGIAINISNPGMLVETDASGYVVQWQGFTPPDAALLQRFSR